jgi:hypothetical protein
MDRYTAVATFVRVLETGRVVLRCRATFYTHPRRVIEEADETEFVARGTHAGLTGSLEALVNLWPRVTRNGLGARPAHEPYHV